ncbi:ECF transporter S component [Clostridium formicaceticum]|uniref:ECF transporter S component n=1 Tax=Clostridium formicaceticum TaxID=1497 RepID=A0AAC9RG69_9CLOT|nr:ECF transporter S component [Clostridium formicaceticum]AOY75868.1 hypothetical protein BJL90_08165 [Clostridium formicaceticum]ARE86209.1 hypothetical protein CLFO_05310 [Clostridium formicaceticum]
METRKVVLGGFFIALGVLFPILFHTVSMAGSVFLPMHIPVLLAGFILGRKYGFFVGLLTPAISSFLTGMPPLMPTLPIMTVELSIYGLIAGLLVEKFQLNTIFSLIGAMVCGRIGALFTVFLMANLLGVVRLAPITWIKGAVVTGLPGMVIQVIFIPTLLYMLKNGLSRDMTHNLK